jgi:hypothetical protein
MFPVESPFKTYTGLDGKPLDNGYVYFGLPHQDPANVSKRVTVYWDPEGTIPAEQPLRTVNGYIMRNGTPANVFFDGAYSELVRDSKMRQVFYARTSDEFSVSKIVSNFLDKLATAVGAALIGWANGGTKISVEQALNTLYLGIVNPANPKFGAKFDGITDDTDAIKAAIAAAPSGSLLAFPPGLSCRVRAGEITVSKSLTIDGNNSKLKHNGKGAGPIMYLARTAGTPGSDVQPFYTLSRIKVSDLRIAGDAEVDVYQYDTGAAQGLVPDLRTSTCDGILMEDVDAIIMDNVVVRDLKGAAFVFGDKSSVRESVFRSCYALQCGNAGTQRASILFLSPLPDANNGIHNHIYFEHLRVVNSFWRSIEVRRGAAVATSFGSFILEFNHCQIDNSMPNAGPMGPRCEMVLIEHCGWHVTFSNTVILNPYGPGGGKWGYPCVRVGTDNYPNSTAERTEFINCRFQHAGYGVGVQVARANMVRFSMNSWASEPSKSRSVVVGNFDPNDNYGVTSPVNVAPYLLFDATNDFSDEGPYFHDPVNRINCLGTWNRPTPDSYLAECFMPGGFKSGDKKFTVAANTNISTVIPLKDFLPAQIENDVNGSTWLVSVSASLADGSQAVEGAALVRFKDANVVGTVWAIPFVKTNEAQLDINIQAPGGAAPGGFIPGSGNRVSVYIGNTTAQTVNVVVTVSRLG